jgi:hypothetical protein
VQDNNDGTAAQPVVAAVQLEGFEEEIADGLDVVQDDSLLKYISLARDTLWPGGILRKAPPRSAAERGIKMLIVQRGKDAAGSSLRISSADNITCQIRDEGSSWFSLGVRAVLDEKLVYSSSLQALYILDNIYLC